MQVKQTILFCVFMLTILMPYYVLSADSTKVDAVDKRPETSSERKDIEVSKDIVVDILSKKPFKDIQEKKVWNFEEDKEGTDINPDLGWLSVVVNFISVIVEAALWLIPLIIIFYLYRYRDYWLNLIQGKKIAQKEAELPETLFGLDVRQESLPDDIEISAQQLWQKNQQREAISLLYRGSLAALFKEYKFDLPSGATEQDCIRQLKLSANNNTTSDTSSQQVSRFTVLTDVWISTAYAHKLPDDVIFNEICHDWNQYFTNSKASK